MARNVNINSALYGDLVLYDTRRDRATDRWLARKYVDTHDPEIPYKIYEWARELDKMEKESSD